jgi:carbon storage regulator CsrA
MLVLTRRVGESIMIGDGMRVTIVSVKGTGQDWDRGAEGGRHS